MTLSPAENPPMPQRSASQPVNPGLHVDSQSEMFNLQAENAALREENARLRRQVDSLYNIAYPGIRSD